VVNPGHYRRERTGPLKEAKWLGQQSLALPATQERSW
jgi:hypothetical protein